MLLYLFPSSTTAELAAGRCGRVARVTAAVEVELCGAGFEMAEEEDDAHFDYLIKRVPVRVLHCEATLSPL